MREHDPWIEIPAMFEGESFYAIKMGFERAQLEFYAEPVQTGGDLTGGSKLFTFHVRQNSMFTAVVLLRELLGVTDPLQDKPFDGDCPCCGARVVESFECPECELGFRSPQDPENRLLPFMREHGAFREFD